MALKRERYEASKQGTSLGVWQEGRRAAAEKRAREGLPPLPDNAMGAPYIETMRRRLAASAARQAEWDAGVKAAYARQIGLR